MQTAVPSTVAASKVARSEAVPLRFRVLGPIEIEIAGSSLPIPGGLARLVLAQLLSQTNRVVPAQDLIDVLWGDDPPRTAPNVLQAHVATLRRALRASGSGLVSRLETDPRGYRLRVEAGELDADTFAGGVAEARRRQDAEPAEAAEMLRGALALWRGPAFAGIDVGVQGGGAAAVRLEEMRLDAREMLAEIGLRLGRSGEVAADLEPLIVEHPFRERLRGLLMIALYRSGRQVDALAAYRRARKSLVEELGVEPGPDLRALELAVLRQDPALMGEPAAGAQDDSRHRHGPAEELVGRYLPVASAPFVGREGELAAIVDRLATERLITITGVGGAGKTRFAIRAATLAHENFPDGVRFVDLTAVPDEERVLSTLASVLEVTEQASRGLLETIASAIADGRRLLLIDNCEHVIEPCAHLVDALLRAAPGLTILATSREPLRLASEVLWRLPPLEVPGDATSTRSELLASDAVRLFVERADRARPTRQWSDDDVRTIAEICRRLDGLPLAIEMAAARLRVLSPQDVLDRLEDRFRLLSDGERTAIPRHRTLRAAIDWSYGLLDEPEKRTLRRMSAFATPVPPAAVDAVCGGDEDDDAVESAMRLADRSMVVADLAPDGRTRFGLLDTIREYGRVHLRSTGEEAVVLRRHREYWTGVAGAAYALRIDEPDQRADELEREQGELRLALDRAHALDPSAELKLAGSLGWFWAAHTHIGEGRRLLDRALAGEAEDPVDRARALCARGSIASLQGEAAQATADLEAGLAVWRGLEDAVEECATLDALGWAMFWAGQDDASGEVFEAGVRLADEVGIPGLVRRTNAGLCQVLVAKGQVDRAVPLAEELVRIAADDLRTAHLGHHFLADCALIGGHPAAARVGYRRSLTLALRMADAVETAIEIEGVAMATAGCGEPEPALHLLGAAEAALDDLGVQIDVPFWNVLLERWIGPARLLLGDRADAISSIGRAVTLDEAARQALGETMNPTETVS